MGFLAPAAAHGASGFRLFQQELHPTIQRQFFGAAADASGHGMPSGNRDAAPGSAPKIILRKEVMTR